MKSTKITRISYTADKSTKEKATFVAAAMGISVSEVVKRSIRDFALNLEPRKRTCGDNRSIDLTVELDPKTLNILKITAERTQMTRSAIIYKCLGKYIQSHIAQAIALTQKRLKEMQELAA